jgi:hypothetical protein
MGDYTVPQRICQDFLSENLKIYPRAPVASDFAAFFMACLPFWEQASENTCKMQHFYAKTP